jgi:hypothetical protein
MIMICIASPKVSDRLTPRKVTLAARIMMLSRIDRLINIMVYRVAESTAKMSAILAKMKTGRERGNSGRATVELKRSRAREMRDASKEARNTD